MNGLRLALLLLVLAGFTLSALGQPASITTERQTIKTYPFGDPDPVPILVSNSKIYPYFKYEGYTHEGRQADWQVVHLENDFVEVWMLPEVGGKVWGAREKSTGEEFIYRNEVMKFRNIAMRGPWTSGGIEFNFGIIGHHPSTATPVDYKIVEEEDGSVSCWVGSLDLPSRTQWRVKIQLPKDKAYFETQALWYNPTPLHQSYYNWMTGAAFATADLEFYCPGDQYLEHGGDPHPWPREYGRNIAAYAENDFLSHKSYHVVGEYNDFFGGYYHDRNYGFGHWSPYDEMPGQKLWLWSLARNGGIWEDLLTDTDGQYIEFQAGRLFNQYSPGGGNNPITQAVFPPHATDKWREIWFPVKSIGGLSDVSPQAVLHVEQSDGKLLIGINGLEQGAGTLQVFSGEEQLLEKGLELSPMSVVKETLTWPDPARPFHIKVAEMGLDYKNNPEALQVKRPFQKPDLPGIPQPEQDFRRAMEWMDFREYGKAEQALKTVLKANPAHLEALSALAELYYRQGLYDLGLERAWLALSIDTYHPAANYVAGILFQAKKDFVNAKEALGWAARSMEFRSAAYGIMGEILLAERSAPEAIRYALQALDFNRFNMQARQVLAVAKRLAGQDTEAQEEISALLAIDPLCHFARFEQFLLDGRVRSKDDFLQNISNELPYQTFLETALIYYRFGQEDAALQVLAAAPDQPLITLWRAFLQQDRELLHQAMSQPPDFVFPFRRETLEVLEWATLQAADWKAKYYLSLNYWGKDRVEEAVQLMESLAETPDYAFFYLTRAPIRESSDPEKALNDLEKAQSLNTESWRIRHRLSQFHHRRENYEAALAASTEAYRKFPDNYTIGMDYVRDLIYTKNYERALSVLRVLQILPFEGASESRRLYEWAHLGQALAQLGNKQYPGAIQTLQQYKEWPERLGVGKPYDPDERLADYLLAIAYRATGATAESEAAKARILDFTRKFPLRNRIQAVLGYRLMTSEELTALEINQHAASEKHAPAMQWALAVARGNDKLAGEIRRRYESLFDGPDFGILQLALRLPFN